MKLKYALPLTFLAGILSAVAIPVIAMHTDTGQQLTRDIAERGMRIQLGHGSTQYVRYGLDGEPSIFGIGCYAVSLSQLQALQNYMGPMADEFVAPFVIRMSAKKLTGTDQLSAADALACSQKLPARYVANLGDGTVQDLFDADKWQATHDWMKIGTVRIYEPCQNMGNRVRAPNYYLVWGKDSAGNALAGAAQCEVQEPLPTASGS